MGAVVTSILTWIVILVLIFLLWSLFKQAPVPTGR